MEKRVVRPVEERIAALDEKIKKHNDAIEAINEETAAKIQKHKDAIESLEAKKIAIQNPKPRAARKKGLKSMIKESGMSDADIAKALGFDTVEDLAAKLCSKSDDAI